MVRKIGSVLCAAALAAALTLPALAASVPASTAGQTDVGYSGALDPRTGLPVTASGAQDYIPLKEGEYSYDEARRCFVNQAGSESFTSSLPNGAVVSSGQSASFTIPSGLSATLYRNGEPVPDADLSNVTETGSYFLEVRSNGGNSASFSFTILGKLTNSLAQITLPEGFSFETVYLNGEELIPGYSNYLELLEDGEYQVHWSCPEIQRSYTLAFTRDTTAPTLALPEVEDGQAHSQVTLEDLEPGCYILLERGGETSTLTSASSVIRDPGDYRLTVCDQAGNSTRYDFTIHMYLNLSAAAAIGLILAGLLGLAAYCRYIRTHPRVG